MALSQREGWSWRRSGGVWGGVLADRVKREMRRDVKGVGWWGRKD